MAVHRLFGTANLFSQFRSIQISNTLTVFDSGDRAGFVIGSIDPHDPRVEEVAFPNRHWMIGMRMLIAVLHELGGYAFVDPQEAIRRQRERQFHCPRCLGSGQVEDFEANWVPCPECR